MGVRYSVSLGSLKAVHQRREARQIYETGELCRTERVGEPSTIGAEARKIEA